MSKNNDVIVQSPHDFATLVTQLMPATTVLHASQTDIDYTTASGSVEPWDDLTRFNKIATQEAPQMAVDKEANSLSRVYSYYSKFNLRLFYV